MKSACCGAEAIAQYSPDDIGGDVCTCNYACGGCGKPCDIAQESPAIAHDSAGIEQETPEIVQAGKQVWVLLRVWDIDDDNEILSIHRSEEGANAALARWEEERNKLFGTHCRILQVEVSE